MPVLAKKNGKWVTIANYTQNTSSSKFKIFTYIPTVDDLEEGEVGFYIYIPPEDELKLYIEGTITEAHIPDGTSSIGSYAFYNHTSLTNVNISDSVTSIVNYAFYYTTSLETVIFRGTPSSIGSSAFYVCSKLSDIYVPWSEGEVANAPWGATNATIHYNTDTSNMGSTTPHTNYPETYAAIIGRTITEINENNFPQDITYIGSRTLSNCPSLIRVTIPDSVTSIGIYALSNCPSLITATIPDSVTSIGAGCFYNCTSLVNTNIPNSITSIPMQFFYGCSSLESVTIPDNITSVQSSSFFYCTSLKTVIFKGTPTTINSNIFRHCTQSTLNIYVPWSEGEVEGAPWEATNATIHYNTDTSNM